MQSLDLFCGAGGLGTGLKEAGIQAAIAVDHWAPAAYTYRLNNPEVDVQIRSVRQMDFSGIDVDLVCGGPSCQGFSTAGNKDPNDPRNSLFEHWLRAVETIRPKHVLFENVRGFSTLYKGAAKHLLVRALRSWGYHVDYGVINMSDYGIPQSRERFILVGSRNQVFLPFRSYEYKRVSVKQAIGDLPVPGSKALADVLHYVPPVSLLVQARMNALEPGQSMKHLPFELQTGGFPNSYRRLVASQPCPTITSTFIAPASGFFHYDQARPLTLREGARIQTFPDSYRFCGTRTEKALQIGNAIPPMMGKILGECFES